MLKQEIAREYVNYDASSGIFTRAKVSGRYGKYKAGSNAGSISVAGDVTLLIDGTRYQAHRVAWLLHYGEWLPRNRRVRHIDGNKQNNAISNLSADPEFSGARASRPDIVRLRECFNYDANSGVLTWKISPRVCTPPGTIAGAKNDQGYIVVNTDKHPLRVHRIAWALHYGEDVARGFEIDHINGNRSDNRICNLRLATRGENNQNSKIRANNKTGVKGVHLRKDTGKYSASICVNGEVTNLGSYATLEEASAARGRASLEMHTHYNPSRLS